MYVCMYVCADLQHHDNTQIYSRAVKILETYFGGEEETDSEINPNLVVDAGGMQQVNHPSPLLHGFIIP